MNRYQHIPGKPGAEKPCSCGSRLAVLFVTEERDGLTERYHACWDCAARLKEAGRTTFQYDADYLMEPLAGTYYASGYVALVEQGQPA